MPTSYARLAGETAPGTEAAAATLSTKKVFVPANEVYLGRGAQFLERDDEMRGLSEPIPLVPERFEPTWRVQSRIYPDTLGMLLASMWGISATGETGATHYVHTAGNGAITDPDSVVIPAGAERHVWTMPLGPSGVTPKTMQINAAYKDEAVFFEGRGCATESLTLTTAERGGAIVEASGPALYVATQADPGLTASTEAVATRPFMYSSLSLVTWLTGAAQASNVTVNLANPVSAVDLLNGSKYPAVMEKDESLVLGTGTISLRHPDVDDLAALLAATEFAAKLRWTSDTVIASAYPYKFFIEMSGAQYASEDISPLQNRRRHDASFNWRAARNASASMTLTLINNVASYA